MTQKQRTEATREFNSFKRGRWKSASAHPYSKGALVHPCPSDRCAHETNSEFEYVPDALTESSFKGFIRPGRLIVFYVAPFGQRTRSIQSQHLYTLENDTMGYTAFTLTSKQKQIFCEYGRNKRQPDKI